MHISGRRVDPRAICMLKSCKAQAVHRTIPDPGRSYSQSPNNVGDYDLLNQVLPAGRVLFYE